MSETNQAPCALASCDRRWQDGLNLLVETKQKYFDPNSFRISLNNTIQTLRNVTFVLQKAKSAFPSFDEWYSPWQERMKADDLMKWLITARNIIVKQGDLETHSLARISIVESWFDSPKFEMDVAPSSRTEDFARLLGQRAPTGIAWDVGLLRVERRWVHDALPEHEILCPIVHSFDILSRLLIDAHKVLLDPLARERCPWFRTVEKAGGRLPPCMLAQDWDRTVWVDLHDGAVMTPVTRTLQQSEEALREAAERYLGAQGLQEELPLPTSLEEVAAALFEKAKRVLQTDGYHSPIAVLGYPDGERTIHQLHMEDRTAKHLMLRRISAEIEKTGAESIILINEAWLSRTDEDPPSTFPADDPDREEALHLLAADAQGNLFAHAAIFVRDAENRIEFTEETHGVTGATNILEPIRDAWRRTRDRAS